MREATAVEDASCVRCGDGATQRVGGLTFCSGSCKRSYLQMDGAV